LGIKKKRLAWEGIYKNTLKMLALLAIIMIETAFSVVHGSSFTTAVHSS